MSAGVHFRLPRLVLSFCQTTSHQRTGSSYTRTLFSAFKSSLPLSPWPETHLIHTPCKWETTPSLLWSSSDPLGGLHTTHSHNQKHTGSWRCSWLLLISFPPGQSKRTGDRGGFSQLHPCWTHDRGGKGATSNGIQSGRNVRVVEMEWATYYFLKEFNRKC